MTRTYTVRVSAIDTPPEIQLGMTASVVFPSSAQSSVVLLPLSAIAGDRANPGVWVVDPKSSRVKLRPVSVGEFREDGVTILSGLAAGDIVVTAGAHRLRNDQPVRL